MRVMSLAVVLIVIVVFTSAQTREQAERTASEQRIRQTYNDYAEAVRKGDRALLNRMVSDEAIFVAEHISHALTKRMLLKEPTYVSAEASAPPALEDIEVRVVGDTAVISGRGETSFHDTFGQEVKRLLRVTAMFVKREERWQLVAMHTSSVR